MSLVGGGIVTGRNQGKTPHDPLTLGTDADTILGLSDQQVTLDSQAANRILAGPESGAVADPTFRALVDADIPAAIARDAEVTSAISSHAGETDPHPGYLIPAEHTAIGDSSPHHAAITLAASADVLLGLSAQELSLDTQLANVIFAGPASGAAAAPTFRALVDTDIPDTITLTNITQITNRSHTSLADIGSLSHATIDSYLDQAVKAASTPTFGGLTLTAFSGVLKASTGVVAGSATIDDIGEGTTYKRLTATKEAYITQDMAVTASPTFVTAKLSGLTNGYLPYHVSDAAGLANSPIYTDGSNICIGDTTNAFMTRGLTINQGAADDEILALKSSDVAHGMTDFAETDTFYNGMKLNALTGGARMCGYTEDKIGLGLFGFGTNDDTTKSIIGEAYIYLYAVKKSGTGVTNPGADANLVVIGSGSSARFIFDQEGSAHADVEWTTFQDHDDLEIIEWIEEEFDRRKGKTPSLKHLFMPHRTTVYENGLMNFYDEGPRAMVNMSRMPMLYAGAFRQLKKRIDELEGRLVEHIN